MRSAKPALIFAVVGMVGFGLWQWRISVSNGPTDAPVSSDSVAPAGSIENAGDRANVDSTGQPALPAPGSMAAELLNTTEANRLQILALAISDARYECPPGASVKAAGSNGAVWRVHCGESNIYWVEVNEFGRLLVTPAPYGDFIGGAGVPRRDFESELPLEQRNQNEQELRLFEQLEPR
jgi:hypothetical protein